MNSIEAEKKTILKSGNKLRVEKWIELLKYFATLQRILYDLIERLRIRSSLKTKRERALSLTV